MIAVFLSTACTADPGADTPVPRANYDVFVEDVQPILAARCGETACHGALDRPLWVYSEVGLRMDADAGSRPVTDAELLANFWCARSFLADVERAERSPLLTKPLAVEAGGVPHAMGPIYKNQVEYEYSILLEWVQAALEDAR